MHLTLITALIFSAGAWSSDGLKIMRKIEQANKGTIGSSSTMTMILIDAQGNKVERQLRAKTLEDSADGEKSVLEFFTPLDVKGTKLLTWVEKDKDNQQWLYLPQFQRVKKINSGNQSGSFMGSEFSFEDIAGQDIERYEYKLLEETGTTWEIESTPKKTSGYSKLVSVFSKGFMNPLSVKYYDRKGELLKTSKLSGHEKTSVGKKVFFLPKEARMQNVQTKKASVIRWDERELGVKHPAREFKPSRLK